MIARTLLALAIFSLSLVSVVPSMATDWLTHRSFYTHSYQTGQRVHQFAAKPVTYHTPRQVSVYHHYRSSVQVADSVSQYHLVERYGDQVRPYGEWRFPYRPFSVPYSQWGPNGNYGPGYGNGGGFYPQYPVPYGGNNWGPFGPGGVNNGTGFPLPWSDGSYPDVRRTQLPPQPFPSPSATFNNKIQGNDNTINNN